jgi:hypothetical protein
VTGDMMRFIPPDQRVALIDASDLTPRYKQLLQIMADAAPYLPENSLAQALGILPLNHHFHRHQEAP